MKALKEVAITISAPVWGSLFLVGFAWGWFRFWFNAGVIAHDEKMVAGWKRRCKPQQQDASDA